jgi:phage virion morphogenesis protein
VGVTGDFSKLRMVAANVGRLAKVPSRVSARVAAAITSEVQKQFVSESDPYGKPWAALAPSTIRRKRGMGKILFRTGSLWATGQARPMGGAGVRVGPFREYGTFHQTGTSRMPSRPIFPYGGLPRAWLAAIKLATEQAMSEAVK